MSDLTLGNTPPYPFISDLAEQRSTIFTRMMKLEQNESRNEDACQPLLHSRMIMSRILSRISEVNLFVYVCQVYAETSKFLMAMARQTLSDYFSIQIFKAQTRSWFHCVCNHDQCFRCPYSSATRLVRSSAWIWLFSSTLNTSACSGD